MLSKYGFQSGKVWELQVCVCVWTEQGEMMRSAPSLCNLLPQSPLHNDIQQQQLLTVLERLAKVCGEHHYAPPCLCLGLYTAAVDASLLNSIRWLNRLHERWSRSLCLFPFSLLSSIPFLYVITHVMCRYEVNQELKEWSLTRQQTFAFFLNCPLKKGLTELSLSRCVSVCVYQCTPQM